MNTIKSADFHYPNCQTWTGGQCNCDEIQDRACKEIQASRASKREEQPHGAMTPGPWEWHVSPGDRGRVKGKLLYRNLWNPEMRQAILDADYSEFNGEGVWETWIRVNEANARTIAALPDVLKALRRMLVTNGGPIDHADTIDGRAYVMVEMDAFEQARTALQKAGCL